MFPKSLFDRLAGIKYFNRWVIFFADLILSVFASSLSFLLASRVLELSITFDTFWKSLSMFTLVSSISFIIFQPYKGVIRHSTFVEAGRIGITALLKVAIILPCMNMLLGKADMRLLFIGGVMDAFLMFFFMIFVRVILIVGYNYIMSHIKVLTHTKGNLLIVGTDFQTGTLLGASLHNIEETYRIQGFLTYGNKSSLRISGHSVYAVSDQESFDKLIDHHFITSILFPNYHSVKEEGERIIRFCEKKKIRMLILPSIDELEGGKINYRNLPEVRIEDLLDREEININMEEIAMTLQDKVILVTGAAGSIGSELCRQLCQFGAKQLILFDSAETPMHTIRLELEEKHPEVKLLPIMGDVRKAERVESVFKRFHPEFVFHAAAYKHVPLMEENPCEAVRTNVFGTMTVADMAVKYGVSKFVMISTDKAVNPTNVMGASKRMAEIYVQSLGLAISKGEKEGKTRFITTRFGNVLGSNGSVIPRFREQLAKGGPLTVTHKDIIRYFMTIPEACRLVLEAGCLGKENEIFVFDMGKPVRIADMAHRMIELAGMEPGKDIMIEYTGLRPGEKLYEELLATKENTLPTFNEKIFCAKVREYKYKLIQPQVLKLCETAKNVDMMETVRQMKKIIPEFKSQQSYFECLDETILPTNGSPKITEVPQEV